MKTDFEKFIEERQTIFTKFWSEEYPKFNHEERIRYWQESTHKGMRTQGEALADEYSEFSKGWYDFAMEHEPNFDSIFKEAMSRVGFDFDWKEYRKRIEG